MSARLFVAVWPDDAARQSLATFIEPARRDAADVRWQPPERWHITLAFLGQADPDKASRRITRLLSRGAPAPDAIRLAGAGTFGPIVWVGVDHGDWLSELAAELQQALHVVDRRFRAHVTVGRLRGASGPGRAREVVPLISSHVGPAWMPTAITLVESTTGPAPEYRILERWPLGHAPVEEPRWPAGRDTSAATLPDSSNSEELEDR